MKIFSLVLIFAISFALIILLTQNAGEITEKFEDIQRYERGLLLMKNIDNNVRTLLSEEGKSQRVVTGNADEVIVSDRDETIRYSINIKENFFDLGEHKEGSIDVISEKTRIELVLNYTGYVDIVNNATIKGPLFIEKLSDTSIRITEK